MYFILHFLVCQYILYFILYSSTGSFHAFRHMYSVCHCNCSRSTNITSYLSSDKILYLTEILLVILQIFLYPVCIDLAADLNEGIRKKYLR